MTAMGGGARVNRSRAIRCGVFLEAREGRGVTGLDWWGVTAFCGRVGLEGWGGVISHKS